MKHNTSFAFTAKTTNPTTLNTVGKPHEMKNICRAIFVFSIFASSSAALAATLSAPTKAWFKGLPVKEGVYAELAKFPNLPFDYVEEFPAIVGARILKDAESTFAPVVVGGKSCVPKTQVDFLNQVSANSGGDSVIREFESQIIHIQVIACLEDVTAAQVTKAFLSAEFKAKSADTIVSSKTVGTRTCQKTQVQMLGESDYCYDDVTFKGLEAYYVHSFNDWNRGNVQAPVYFREILTAAADVEVNGKPGAVFYTNVYVRGAKLPGLFKGFAKSTIAQGQQKSLDTLQSIARKK